MSSSQDDTLAEIWAREYNNWLAQRHVESESGRTYQAIRTSDPFEARQSRERQVKQDSQTTFFKDISSEVLDNIEALCYTLSCDSSIPQEIKERLYRYCTELTLELDEYQKKYPY